MLGQPPLPQLCLQVNKETMYNQHVMKVAIFIYCPAQPPMTTMATASSSPTPAGAASCDMMTCIIPIVVVVPIVVMVAIIIVSVLLIKTCNRSANGSYPILPSCVSYSILPSCVSYPILPSCVNYPILPSCVSCPILPSCVSYPILPSCVSCPILPSCVNYPILPSCVSYPSYHHV